MERLYLWTLASSVILSSVFGLQDLEYTFVNNLSTNGHQASDPSSIESRVMKSQQTDAYVQESAILQGYLNGGGGDIDERGAPLYENIKVTSVVDGRERDGLLRCHECKSKEGAFDDDCYRVNGTSNFLNNCSFDERFCQVHRVEYLTGADSIESGRDPDQFLDWSMQRGCAKECSDFCVTIGARTKIRYCTSCCEEDGCNVDNGSVTSTQFYGSIYVITLSYILLFHNNS